MRLSQEINRYLQKVVIAVRDYYYWKNPYVKLTTSQKGNGYIQKIVIAVRDYYFWKNPYVKLTASQRDKSIYTKGCNHKKESDLKERNECNTRKVICYGKTEKS